MFRKKTRVTFSFTDSSSFSFYFISTAGRKVLLELESEIGPSWVSLIAQKAEAHRRPVCRLRPNFSQNVNTRSYSLFFTLYCIIEAAESCLVASPNEVRLHILLQTSNGNRSPSLMVHSKLWLMKLKILLLYSKYEMN